MLLTHDTLQKGKTSSLFHFFPPDIWGGGEVGWPGFYIKMCMRIISEVCSSLQQEHKLTTSNPQRGTKGKTPGKQKT